MRLALLTTSDLDAPSPRGRWLPLGRELVRHGYQVNLLMTHPTFDRLPRHERHGRIDGVTTHYVAQMHTYGPPGARRYFGPLALLRVALQGALALAWATIQARPQAIHLCKPQPINGLAGLITARILGCPLYVDCDDYEAGNNRFSGAWQQRIVQFFEDHLPRQAAGVTVNTNFLAERCRRRGIAEAQIVYVPNGIAAVQLQAPNAHAVAQLRATLGLNGQQVVLYVGTLSEVSHHVGLLLEAFSLLQDQRPTARLLLIGDGDDRALLEQRAGALGIAERTQFIGRVAAALVPLYFGLAACSVDPVADTPVAQGRSPLKIVESLAAGVPVVTGAVGDRPHMLDHGSAGVLTAAGSAQALADGIAHLLANEQLQRNLAAGAQRQAERYRWDRLALDWMALYGGEKKLR
jgi:glycosyltransferase involved in cell wall biosynthesis